MTEEDWNIESLKNNHDFLTFNQKPKELQITNINFPQIVKEERNLLLELLCLMSNEMSKDFSQYIGLKVFEVLHKDCSTKFKKIVNNKDICNNVAKTYLVSREKLTRKHSLSLILFELLNILESIYNNNTQTMYDVMGWKDKRSDTLPAKKSFVYQQYAANNQVLIDYFKPYNELKQKRLIKWVIILLIINIIIYFSGYSKYSIKNFRGEKYLSEIYERQDYLQQRAEMYNTTIEEEYIKYIKEREQEDALKQLEKDEL